MEMVPFFCRDTLDGVLGQVYGVLHAHQTCKVALLTHLLVDLLGYTLGLVPLCNVGFEF